MLIAAHGEPRQAADCGERGFEERWAETRDEVATDVRRGARAVRARRASDGARSPPPSRRASSGRWPSVGRSRATSSAPLDEAADGARVHRGGREELHRAPPALPGPEGARTLAPAGATRRWRSRNATGSTAIVVDKLKRQARTSTPAASEVATFSAELGAKGLRRKLHSGDQATPEGRYRVTEVRGPGPHELLQGADARLPQRRGPRPLRARASAPARCRCAPASAA